MEPVISEAEATVQSSPADLGSDESTIQQMLDVLHDSRATLEAVSLPDQAKTLFSSTPGGGQMSDQHGQARHHINVSLDDMSDGFLRYRNAVTGLTGEVGDVETRTHPNLTRPLNATDCIVTPCFGSPSRCVPDPAPSQGTIDASQRVTP